MEKDIKTTTYYSNCIKVKMSPYDVLFECGKNIPIEDPEKNEINLIFERDFYLYNSPQHFKALVNVLNQHLKKYEEAFGVINLPSDKK
jgi:hypothetical protein